MRQFSKSATKFLLSDEEVNLTALSKEMGVSIQTLIRLRDGKCTPNANTLVSLADCTGRPLKYFFENELTSKLNKPA